MKYYRIIIVLILGLNINIFSQEKPEINLVQSYSGKIGFYNPDKKLNNGFLIGIDGITEFIKYNFLLSGSLDLYFKKTFNPFVNEKPSINDQSLVLLPLYINGGYKLIEIPDAGTKVYIGLGGGYYFHFYSVTYQSSSGGLIGSLVNKDASKQGGDFLFTLFGRILIGKIFVEPRFYFASASTETFDNYKIEIDPSGFAISLGFQY